jgi:hypothetical protein
VLETAVARQEGGLLALVEQLGPGLTAPDDPARLRSTELLAVVLQLLPLHGSTPSDQEVGVLFAFYAGRLKDAACLKAVLDGLVALSASPHFAAHARAAVTAVFKEIQVQTMPQSVRQRVFELMTALLTNYSAALVGMGETFSETVIRQIDGEKDPRCLLLVFRFVPMVAKLFPIARCYEDLFEVVSCYFPITFTQPKNDPIGITQADLLDSLTECLTANPLFATLVLDLVFEKLGSGVDLAKVQGYELLGHSATIFGMPGFGTALSQIYTAVRTEMFQSHDEGIKTVALKALTKVATMVAAAEVKVNSATGAMEVESAADTAASSGHGHSHGGTSCSGAGTGAAVPENSEAASAGGCCGGGSSGRGCSGANDTPSIGGGVSNEDHALEGGAAAAVDPQSAFLAAAAADPLAAFLGPLINESTRHLNDFDVGLIRLHGRLLDAIARGSEKSCRCLCDAYLPELLRKATPGASNDHRMAYASVLTALVEATLAVNGVGPGSLMSEHKDVALAMYKEMLVSDQSNLRAAGLAGVSKLLATGLLAVADVQHMCTSAVGSLLQDKVEVVRVEARTAVKAIAVQSAESIQTLTIPPLIARLSATDASLPSSEQAHELVAVLGDVATTFQLAVSVLAVFIPLLEATGLNVAQSHIAAAVVEGVRDLLVGMATQYPDDDLFSVAIKPCLVAVLAPIGKANNGSALLWPSAVLATLATGLQACCQAMPSEQQSAALRIVVSVFRDGDLGAIGIESSGDVAFLKESHMPAASAIVLLPALLGSFRGTVTSTLDGVTALATMLIEAASSGADAGQCRAAAITAAALVNKCTTEALVGYLDELSGMLGGQLQATASAAADRAGHIATWAWLCKALVVRGHPSAKAFTATLVGFLGDPEMGMAAAESFAIVVNNCAEALNPKSHANFRIMFRQRYFLENVPALIAGLHNAAPELKKHYLIALSHLLGAVTHQVLLSELSRVFPVLVQSLHQTETSLVGPTIKILQRLVVDVPEFVADHVDSLVPLLIDLAAHTKMAVRIAVLQCLCSVASLPEHKIFPLAAGVLKALRTNIDDHKRLVRAEAVKCSSKWYLIGGSGAQ